MSHNEFNENASMQINPTRRTPQRVDMLNKSYLTNISIACCHCLIVNKNQKAICCKCRAAWHVKCIRIQKKEDITLGQWCCPRCVHQQSNLNVQTENEARSNVTNQILDEITPAQQLNNHLSQNSHAPSHRSQTEALINNDTHQQVNDQRSISRHTVSRRSQNSMANRENAQLILEREIQLKRLRDERRKEEEEIDRRRIQRMLEAEEDEIRIIEQSRQVLTHQRNCSSRASYISFNDMENVERWVNQSVVSHTVRNENAITINQNPNQVSNYRQMNKLHETPVRDTVHRENINTQQSLPWLNPVTTEQEFLVSVGVGNINPGNITNS